MLQHREEFSLRLKLNLKEGQLPALSVLRQLSKEKSRFRKRSDLFDDFVIPVLELRLFYVCFKMRQCWDYVKGQPSATHRKMQEGLKSGFGCGPGHV